LISSANSSLLYLLDDGRPLWIEAAATISELSDTKIGRMPRRLNLRKLFTLITLSVLAELSLFAQTESSIKNVFWQPKRVNDVN
jgi:hypothetical protein